MSRAEDTNDPGTARITATGEEDDCIVLLGSMMLGERAPSVLLVALHSPQDGPNGGIVAPRDTRVVRSGDTG